MPLLSLRCTHRYPSGFALDAAFDVEHAFTALCGPSGSGKTSLLNVIAGFVRPVQGLVRLGERTLLDTARGIHLPARRRNLGVVFQGGLLFPHLSVEGNLRHGQRRQRRSGAPACGSRLDFRRVVDVLEIGPLLARFPRNLSGGEKQRVALGRALLSGPELLLMDEPLAALDARLRDRLLRYLQRAVEEWQIPALFVTHSQAEVRMAAQWVIALDQGRVVAAGTPDAALGRSETMAWTSAAAPVNLLRLEHCERREDCIVGRVGAQELTLPLDDGAPLPGCPAALPQFVQFSPKDVILARHDVADVSARNHLRGTVRRLLTVEHAVFVAVDIGQILWAEVTHQAVAALGLAAGVEVVCLVKTQSLIPIA
jgi:molybdate transport system ATP-binding protein